MMRQMASKSINFSSIGMLALVLACKKPPEVATPEIPVEEVTEEVTEAAEEVVEEAAEEVEAVTETAQETGEATETEEASGTGEDSDMEFSKEASAQKYGDELNDAIALLGAEETTQAGLNALEDLSLKAQDLPQVYYNMGVANLKLGNASAAEDAFRQTTQIDPTFSKAWVNLGVMYERRQDFNTAFDLYSEGLEHNETDADLIAGQVACLRKMKRYEEAIEYAQEALKKNANNISAYNEIGTVYLEQEDYDKASFILQQAMSRNGGEENALIQSNMGKIYYAEGKIPQAKASFSKAIELDPNLIDAALLLSFIHLDNRAWAAAEEVLSNAIKLEPNNAAVLNSMGIAKRGLGQFDEAEKLYREALVFEPDNLEPLLNLAVLEADYRNKYDEAFALLDEYVSSGGDNKDLVKQWSTEFEESKKAYEREQRKREFFLKRQQAREEAERKAEEERKRQEELQENQPPERDGNFDEFNGLEGSQDGTEEGSEDGSEGGEDTEGTEGAEDGENTEGTDGENVEEGSEEGSPEDDGTEEGSEDEGSEGAEGSWGSGVEGAEGEETATEGEGAEETPDVNAGEGTEETDGSDGSDAPENTEGTDNEEAVEGSEDTGSDSEGSDNNEGSWGGGDVEVSCFAIDSCEDMSQQCSQSGVCLPKGQVGTYEAGDSCVDSTECAFGLQCQDQICDEGGE